MLTLLDRRAARVERAERLLAAFSYREVLKRGFALVRDRDGRPLRTAAGITNGARLDIEFADGRIGAVAEDSVAGRKLQAAAPRPKTGTRGSGSGGQGNLFG